MDVESIQAYATKIVNRFKRISPKEVRAQLEYFYELEQIRPLTHLPNVSL
jgi:hypothetical protein